MLAHIKYKAYTDKKTDASQLKEGDYVCVCYSPQNIIKEM